MGNQVKRIGGIGGRRGGGTRHRWVYRMAAALALMVVAMTAATPTAQAATVTYQIVTNEIAAKQPDNSMVKVYRFDPGVYVVMQGDLVNLNVRGLKGHDHPIVIEGYDIRGIVKRNATTNFSFVASRAGTFRIICTTHMDAAHEGPMEAYLIVLPKK